MLIGVMPSCAAMPAGDPGLACAKVVLPANKMAFDNAVLADPRGAVSSSRIVNHRGKLTMEMVLALVIKPMPATGTSAELPMLPLGKGV